MNPALEPDKMLPRMEKFQARHGRENFLRLSPLILNLINSDRLDILAAFLSSFRKLPKEEDAVREYISLVRSMDESELELTLQDLFHKGNSAKDVLLQIKEDYERVKPYAKILQERSVPSSVNCPLVRQKDGSFLFSKTGANSAQVEYLHLLFYGCLAYTLNDLSRGKIESFHRTEPNLVEGFSVTGISARTWAAFLRMCIYPSKIYNFLATSLEAGNKMPDGNGCANGMDIDLEDILSLPMAPHPFRVWFSISDKKRKIERYTVYLSCINPFPIFYRVGKFVSTSRLLMNAVEVVPGTVSGQRGKLIKCYEPERFVARTGVRGALRITIHNPYVLPPYVFSDMDRAIYSYNYDAISRRTLLKNLFEVLKRKKLGHAIQAFDTEFLCFLASIADAEPQDIKRDAYSYLYTLPSDFEQAYLYLDRFYRKELPIGIRIKRWGFLSKYFV